MRSARASTLQSVTSLDSLLFVEEEFQLAEQIEHLSASVTPTQMLAEGRFERRARGLHRRRFHPASERVEDGHAGLVVALHGLDDPDRLGRDDFESGERGQTLQCVATAGAALRVSDPEGLGALVDPTRESAPPEIEEDARRSAAIQARHPRTARATPRGRDPGTVEYSSSSHDYRLSTWLGDRSDGSADDHVVPISHDRSPQMASVRRSGDNKIKNLDEEHLPRSSLAASTSLSQGEGPENSRSW